jgi:hypothetical protein
MVHKKIKEIPDGMGSNAASYLPSLFNIMKT